MAESTIPFTGKEVNLLRKYYGFYRNLDKGVVEPITDEQYRFVAVCMGELLPTSLHEHVWCKMKSFLALSKIPESELLQSNFAILNKALDFQTKLHEIGPKLTDERLAKVSPRKRAILKLRFGNSALTSDEMLKVPCEMRKAAEAVKSRSLREVGALMGVSKERIRQLENRAIEQLGIT